MTPTELVTYLLPFVVYIVTAIVKALGPKLPGWVVVSLVVPALSAIGSYVGTLVAPGSSWLVAFGVGLSATFINELVSKLMGLTKPTV